MQPNLLIKLTFKVYEYEDDEAEAADDQRPSQQRDARIARQPAKEPRAAAWNVVHVCSQSRVGNDVR